MQKIHFKAPNCWINDPNGFIWYKGQYHLFYQCFPTHRSGAECTGTRCQQGSGELEEKGIAHPTKTMTQRLFPAVLWSRTERCTCTIPVSTIWRRIRRTLTTVGTISFSRHR
ncbi:MAG: hypothetical protein ACLT3Y_02225 [Ruminococcus callidus]